MKNVFIKGSGYYEVKEEISWAYLALKALRIM